MRKSYVWDPLRRYLATSLTILLIGVTGCTTDDSTPEGNDPDGDGVETVEDNCPDTPNPEQFDHDGDTLGDECDVVITRLGISTDELPHAITVTYVDNMPLRPAGLFSIFNGTGESQGWAVKVDPPTPWIQVMSEGHVDAGEVTTISAALNSEELVRAKSVETTVTVVVTDGSELSSDVSIVLAPPPKRGECTYLVTLTKITVVTRQAILRDGLALEPFADLNAVGLGRYRSPRVGTHVLRAGQSVVPNVLFAMGNDTKGNNVNVTVIADVDEIDFFPINPDDLRAQGQSGVANFNFICDNGIQTQVIPITIFGNVPGEGNGLVEIELEVQWDP